MPFPPIVSSCGLTGRAPARGTTRVERHQLAEDPPTRRRSPRSSGAQNRRLKVQVNDRLVATTLPLWSVISG
jgi:hypothetical protein